MAQTSRELFERVGAVLSCDAQFLGLCQEANILHPADRFEEAGEAS